MLMDPEECAAWAEGLVSAIKVTEDPKRLAHIEGLLAKARPDLSDQRFAEVVAWWIGWRRRELDPSIDWRAKIDGLTAKSKAMTGEAA